MKKIFRLFIPILLFIISINVYASTNLLERNEDNNWGVNKNIEITTTRLDIIKNTKYVDASEKIYDFSDILSDEDEKVIKEYVDKFISVTNMDLVILTDSVPYTYDEKNAEYAVDFYDYNNFGIDYDKYSGVILFRNTYESDPYYGVYNTGIAQQYFTEARYNATLDKMYTYFRGKMYVAGIKLFIDDFINYYELGIPKDYSDSYIDENGYLIVPSRFNPPIEVAAIISFVITAITIGILVSKNKMVKKAVTANDYEDANSMKYSLKESHLVSTNTVRHYHPPHESSGGGGGSFGGSSHSFGGSSGIGHSGGGRHG